MYYTFSKWLEFRESHKWGKPRRRMAIAPSNPMMRQGIDSFQMAQPSSSVAPSNPMMRQGIDSDVSGKYDDENHSKHGWFNKLARLTNKCMKKGFDRVAAFIAQHKDAISGALFAASGTAAFFNPYVSAALSIAGGVLPILVEILKDLEPHFQGDPDYHDIDDVLKKVQTT